jgi:hypothetical protein
MTIEEISGELGMCVQTISKWIKEAGIDVRRSIYSIDEHYFDVIDDPNKAYILGLLYSDGCNSTDKNEILISLQEEDKYILEKISNLLQCDKPLEYSPRHQKCERHKDQYRFRVKNKHMSQTLERLGVVKAKSLILEFPYWMSKDLIPHFVRGYFDGDGHIVNKHGRYGMNIIGTKMLCDGIQNFVENELNIVCHCYDSSSHNGVTVQLHITKKDMCKKFFDWIYADANLYLTRKHDVYISKYCSEENINNASIDVAS